jgi:actin related protein 2/3 complex subunit 2
MLLLDSHNLLIQTILTEKFAAPNPSGVDQVITDFDNVTFHLSNPQGPDDRPVKTLIHLSMAIKCYKDLVQYGAKDVLEREYKGMIIDVEQGYDFTIEVNLAQLPESQGFRLQGNVDNCRRTRGTNQTSRTNEAECSCCTI